MLGLLKSQQGALALAAGLVVGAGWAWYALTPDSAPSPPAPQQTAIAVPSQQPPSASKPDGNAADAKAKPEAAKAPDSAKIDTSKTDIDKPDEAPAGLPVQRPEFDIVRVEPSGDSVVAGRGAPGATIALVDGDKKLADAVANANGEVVFLPPPLAPGEHVLALKSVLGGAAPVISAQSVTVIVQPGSKEAPLVALTAPGKPTAILSDSGGSAKPKPAPAPTSLASARAPAEAPASAKAVPQVAIRTAEAELGGSFFASGTAPPGSQNRLYLNGAFLGKVVADLNGYWSFKVEKGMTPGNYVVRADQVEPQSGKVVARAEVPFSFQAAPTPAAPAPEKPKQAEAPAAPPRPAAAAATPASPANAGPAAANPAPAPTVIKEIRTATVIRGDSLWRISRKMLGRGIRYTQIYEANSSQIRNPRLVFPGQIFVMPSDPG